MNKINVICWTGWYDSFETYVCVYSLGCQRPVSDCCIKLKAWFRSQLKNIYILKKIYPNYPKKKIYIIKGFLCPKPMILSEPNNFHPISILPLLSKPIERHIHKHLPTFLTEHNLLCQSQSGFRPKHSCHTALA